MSDPRHRLEPAVRSIDFDAVAPPRARATYIPPQPYAPSTPARMPSGDGPDQWAESPTPESEDSTQLADASHSSR